MSKQLNRLLIVDRAEEWSCQFSRLGRRMGYSTEAAGGLAEFGDALDTFSPTVVLIDLPSVANDGPAYLKALREHASDALLILIAEHDPRSLVTAKQLAEVLGLPVVASERSPATINVVRNELRKSRQSHNGATLEDLRSGLERGDVRPYYRPRVSFREQQGWPITEVEALVQWHVEGTDIAAPDDFYHLADQGGLLPAITKGLLERVIEQLQYWRGRRSALGVAIHVPEAALADDTLPKFLGERFAAAGLEPSNLTLEVSETAVLGYSTKAIENLRRLKALGFRLAIDDFGIGYSSLEELCRLKADELKVDRCLVLETRTSGDARRILEATVALAQKLGLSVCVDGVDSERALQYLGRIGCDKAQGDFVGPALNPTSLESRIAEWNVPAVAC